MEQSRLKAISACVGHPTTSEEMNIKNAHPKHGHKKTKITVFH